MASARKHREFLLELSDTETSSPLVAVKLRQILTKKAARERKYIHIPFEQRGKARKARAMWDSEKKSWFVGPYATRDRIENFIRMNEQKRQRNTGTERSSASNYLTMERRSCSRSFPMGVVIQVVAITANFSSLLSEA